jgi:hypothetical protein
MRFIRQVSCVIILTFFGFASPDLLAQQQSSDTGGLRVSLMKKSPRRRGQNASITAMQDYFQMFDKPVALPDVPPPGGAKFMGGQLRVDDKSHMTHISERYGTKSHPKDIIDFYAAALNANKWKISVTTSNSLQAKKEDKDLVITIANATDPKMTTDFHLSYTYRSR